MTERKQTQEVVLGNPVETVVRGMAGRVRIRVLFQVRSRDPRPERTNSGLGIEGSLTSGRSRGDSVLILSLCLLISCEEHTVYRVEFLE